MKKKASGFNILANTVMLIWTFIVVAPFVLLFLSSITEEKTLVLNGYSFFPKSFSLDSYAYILRSRNTILRSYGVSILVMTIGTAVNLLLTSLMAYPLSVKNLPYKRVLNFFVFFTMLFNGGIVPSYLMWSGFFHIKDTLWAQLLPNLLMNAWSVLLMRTYFTTSIPDGIYEAAEIDGASHFVVFTKIVLPLGKPILITMGTFAGLAYWNDWTNGLYYLVKNEKLYNIQNLLNQMISNVQYLTTAEATYASSASTAIPSTGIQMAIAFVAILPIMMIFPTFQKYYAKGITLGGLKG